MTEQQMSGGVYRHYKHGRYLVLMVATESTNERVGRPVVVYASLDKGTIRCRDLAEFLEPVEWLDGATRPRFERERTP